MVGCLLASFQENKNISKVDFYDSRVSSSNSSTKLFRRGISTLKILIALPSDERQFKVGSESHVPHNVNFDLSLFSDRYFK